ncbi:hypothetical protein B0T21DRAFT_1804 [Apiosordaria backusii]|uniref:Uncharacterized protein n=1 Tax=Apiosordaria backusii TaxID=314023 RepID=A0AA40EXH1_9PEZI|nr:hypothetical protein B0T21DRAFT_1804 [Apiosordaria backusii]
MARNPTGHTKPQKDIVRKRTDSAQRKAVQTGRACNIFIAIVYWNPNHGRLKGNGYLPKDMDIPDVNEFLEKLFIGGRPTERRTRTRKQHRRAKEVSDEIVVEPVQSSPDKDESVEVQPSMPTLQSEATDHSGSEGSHMDGSITETTSTDIGNQVTTNEPPLDDIYTHTHTHNLFRPAGLTRKGNYHTSSNTFPKMHPGLLKPVRPPFLAYILKLLPFLLRLLVG